MLNTTLEIFIVVNALYAWVFLSKYTDQYYETASKFVNQWLGKIRYQA